MRKRASMALLCVVLALSVIECAQAEKKVLFVCTGNYYRSRFAEALFNQGARDTSLRWKAISRGLQIKEGRNGISPLCEDALTTRGVPQELFKGNPQALTQDDLGKSDYVVLMDEAEHRPIFEKQFPGQDNRKLHFWHIPDDPKMSPPDAFQEMSRQVADLLHSLAAAK